MKRRQIQLTLALHKIDQLLAQVKTISIQPEEIPVKTALVAGLERWKEIAQQELIRNSSESVH